MRNLAPWEMLFDTLLLSWLLESQPLKEGLLAVSAVSCNKINWHWRVYSSVAGYYVTRKAWSNMGCKAAIEMSILRLLSQWFTVAFGYLLLGIHGALFCRLIQLLAKAATQKLAANRLCGEFTADVANIEYHPVLILVLLQIFQPTWIFRRKNAFVRCRYWPAVTTGMLLSGYGTNLNLGLSGPRFYVGEKIRYPRIGGTSKSRLRLTVIGLSTFDSFSWLCWLLPCNVWMVCLCSSGVIG